MTVDQDSTSHEESIADADLVLRTRSGDAAAFGELWRRHYPSGMAVARSITSSIDPDDLVQESYTRIYQAIVKGGGPNGSFRAYLFTSIRNTAAAWGRSRRESAIDELDTVADPDSTEQAANEALDRSLTAQAFRSLPSRWQEVLWYTEIEQMKPQEAGPLLGMKAGAVSQLAFRAREGLREAWIQAHLRSAAPGSDCQWTIEHLGAYSRGNLGPRDHRRLEQHLEECARCMIVAAEAKDVSKRLALVLLPLVLGVSGSAGYLATIQGGGTPIVALAAMPSGITQGAVVAGGGTTAAGSASGAGGAGGSAGGGATGATSGGMLSGMGALVGAGSAALVVAGVVAAAAIVPGLTGATPTASLPSAGDTDSSSISADVGPDDAMTEEKTEVIDDTEPEPDPAPEAPPVEAPITPEPAQDTAPATTAPTAPVQAAPTPPPVQPGEGTVDPGDGEGEPGDGEGEPGDGEGEPGDGEGEPGEGENGSGLPAGTPTFDAATVTLVFDGDNLVTTHYVVPVRGAAGADVSTRVGGGSGGNGTTTLTATESDPAIGYGEIDLRPSLQQICDNATVEFFYTAGDQTGLAASTTLRELNGFDPGVLCILAFDVTASELSTTAPATDAPAADAAAPVEAPAPVEAAPVEAAAPVEVPAPVEAPAPAPAPAETAAPEATAVRQDPATVVDEAVPAL